MSNLFGPEEYSPELELFNRVHVEDAEEAIQLYKMYLRDCQSPSEALELVITDLVPSTFLQNLENRSPERPSN